MLRVVKWFLVLDLLLVAAIVGWMLFGWTTEHGCVGTKRMYRVLGVYTHVALDSSNDGRWDFVATFDRDTPADLPGADPRRYREDRDFDGVYDIWVHRTAEVHGRSTLHWRVDLNRDGEPDWEFTEADETVAYKAIKARRGY